MKKVACILRILSAFLGAGMLIRPGGGWLSLALWVPKTLAGVWAPCLVLAARHVVRVTPHDGFERRVGPLVLSRLCQGR